MLAKCLPRCTDNKLQGPKNETEMARELSNQINQKSIIFSTQSIQGYINLQGSSHFDKATNTDIPTPHVQTRRVNIGQSGQKTISKKPKLQALQQKKMFDWLES